MASKKRGLGKGLDSLIPEGKIKVGTGKPGGAALIDEKDAVIEIDIKRPLMKTSLTSWQIQ